MTQEELDVKRARLLELAEERMAVLDSQIAAYAAERAARQQLYECLGTVQSIRDERDAILDSMEAHRAAAEALEEAAEL